MNDHPGHLSSVLLSLKTFLPNMMSLHKNLYSMRRRLQGRKYPETTLLCFKSCYLPFANAGQYSTRLKQYFSDQFDTLLNPSSITPSLSLFK